jgi:hypothetical protein
MNRRGVIYDAGATFSGYGWRFSTRPHFDPAVTRRELEIIRDDLHCNAVRIGATDLARLVAAAEDALALGLEVWLSPSLFEQSQQQTIDGLVRAAAAAESLRQRYPRRLVFVAGTEATLFTRGIVPGNTIAKRFTSPANQQAMKAGKHNAPLNDYLARVCQAVRAVFGGQLSYASLPFEAVDWDLFDIIGIDHYRDARVKDSYTQRLAPLLRLGKPVVVTEFGMRTFRGADSSGVLGFGVVDNTSLLLHGLPVVGRFVRARLNGDYVRDEAEQAREIAETLGILDRAGVDGAFVATFTEPAMTYSENPRYDLDTSAMSLVKTYSTGHGTTYPDMTWEPKTAFRAVASYYGDGPASAPARETTGRETTARETTARETTARETTARETTARDTTAGEAAAGETTAGEAAAGEAAGE